MICDSSDDHMEVRGGQTTTAACDIGGRKHQLEGEGNFA